MESSVAFKPQLEILSASGPVVQVQQIYSILKSISFCWLAVEELDLKLQQQQLDQDLMYFQIGTQLFFCSKSLNQTIARVDFKY